MRELTFGFSPCPNDTFAFHALVHGLVDAPFRVRPVLLDIEELNRRAHSGAFDLTKLSVGAFAAVGEGYRLLRSGAALGAGVGPLVVAREAMSLDDAMRGRVAIPGRETTAYRLLRLAAPAIGDVVELRYDQILHAVEQGEVDAGLIIHESRFTYADYGLTRVIDLGDWWEHETGLPVPLAGICARADLDVELANAALAAIRASVQYAFDHPEASRAYVRAHAQELSDEVCAQLCQRAQPRYRRRWHAGDRAVGAGFIGVATPVASRTMDVHGRRIGTSTALPGNSCNRSGPPASAADSSLTSRPVPWLT
jgi:1,4-dihydroxy-6-naphthoate synthase